MANRLFPVFDVPSTLAEETEPKTQYAPAPMWDMDTGDFITDGAGRIIYGSGYDAWVLWCTKSILTQRWTHDGYNSNEGIEAEQAFKEPDRESIESAFERTITEALLADPMGRTTQVRDFEFTWETNNLLIECIVIGINGDTANLKAKLNT